MSPAFDALMPESIGPRWPLRLWIIRHGESAGNVARDAARLARRAVIDIAERDADVPLSSLGREQSSAVGRWFSLLPGEERPDVVLVSPYLRARQTAELMVAAGALATDEAGAPLADERLREKEFGIFDRLTHIGIEQQFPDQVELRRRLGKFYYRPPGGESWCDVILRLRSALDTVSLHYPNRRVLIVCHQVIVLCLRYLLEHLTEEELLGIDAAGDVANCSVTEYRLVQDHGGAHLALEKYNFVAPLEREGTPVTDRPDVPVAAR
ncbi:MAG: histidine phosphatase family protein [Gemmatimonadaceae bacterium]